MRPGKAASQAGHAFLDAFLKSDLKTQARYFSNGEGTKVVLEAEDEVALRELHARAFELGLPCSLVVESGHVLPPVFDGSSIITALGIGPASRSVLRPLLRRLRLH